MYLINHTACSGTGTLEAILEVKAALPEVKAAFLEVSTLLKLKDLVSLEDLVGRSVGE